MGTMKKLRLLLIATPDSVHLAVAEALSRKTQFLSQFFVISTSPIEMSCSRARQCQAQDKRESPTWTKVLGQA